MSAGGGPGPNVPETTSPAPGDRTSDRHPSVFEPATLVAGVGLAALGTVIGLELLTRVGITPNTSIVGAVFAMALGRIPLSVLTRFRDVARQNLLQTVTSAATFGGANAVFLPLGVVWLTGHPDLLPAMMTGAVLGLLIDATLMFWTFDSRVFPARGAWPFGIATAEVLKAGDRGGRRARLLLAGGGVGGLGQLAGIPMDVIGVCWIGNVWALAMFGVGLLVRAYAPVTVGVDVAGLYVPHGVMIGAGLAALGQILLGLGRRSPAPASASVGPAGSWIPLGRGLRWGFLAFVLAAALLAGQAGLQDSLTAGRLAGFAVFAAVAALVSEQIVGLSAMHAGWFPAFATALVFLVLGLLMDFPEVPLALLVGFTASTGPAFADLGYDFKTGWILRGCGEDPAYERDGRRQQYYAALVGFAIAVLLVGTTAARYFAADLVPPADRVYAATIAAGADPALLANLARWAVLGAAIQTAGGASRQMGILLATGLLIDNGVAGWTALVALGVRGVVLRVLGERVRQPMYVLAGGFIAGSALTSFGTATLRLR